MHQGDYLIISVCRSYLFHLSDSGKLMTSVQLIIEHTVTTIFQEVTLYILVGGYRCFREKFCLHIKFNIQWSECLGFHISYLTLRSLKNPLPYSLVPKILLTQSTMLQDPELPPLFSATTMLATTGYDCVMKPFSTSRQEDIFCGSVPP